MGFYFILKSAQEKPVKAQTFISLKIDLCQDINGVHAFIRYLDGILISLKEVYSAPLRLCLFVNSVEMNYHICYSSYLGWCSNVLMEQFLQGNVPLKHLINEETLFMS